MLTDRNAYTIPAFPGSWPVGTIINDPTFGNRVARMTDGNVLAGTPGVSFGGPSAGYQHQFSAGSTKFYVIGSAGGVVPYAFNAAAMTRARISGAGDGGLQISTVSTEPQFSYVDDDLIYVTGQNGTHSTPIIRKYSFTGAAYTDLFDMWPILNGIGKTIPDSSFCPNIFSSEASPEKIVCMCPTQAGDDNYLVPVFEVGNPSHYAVLDTMASTVSVNGGSFTAVNITLGFHLHGVDIDRSGRYVCLFTAGADIALGKARKYIWDTQTNLVTAMTLYPFAHTCMGWSDFLNMDGVHPTPYDNLVITWRSLADINGAVRSCIKVPQTVGEIYVDGHTTWHNAKATSLEPTTLEVYRSQDGPSDSPHNDAPLRAWDGEIISVPTDDIDTNVYRQCHHHSIVRDDVDTPGKQPFYYQPRSNNSQDGKWCLFSSNGDRTLGTDTHPQDSVTTKRYDVFLVELLYTSGRRARRRRGSFR